MMNIYKYNVLKLLRLGRKFSRILAINENEIHNIKKNDILTITRIIPIRDILYVSLIDSNRFSIHFSDLNEPQTKICF